MTVIHLPERDAEPLTPQQVRLYSKIKERYERAKRMQDDDVIDELICNAIESGLLDYVEGLFRVFVSPGGGDAEAFARGLTKAREAYRSALAIVIKSKQT